MKRLEVIDWDDSDAIDELVGEMAQGNEPGFQVDQVSEVDETMVSLSQIATAYEAHVGEKTYFNTATLSPKSAFHHRLIMPGIPHVDNSFRALAVHHELAQETPVRLASLRKSSSRQDTFSRLHARNQRRGNTLIGRLTIFAESSFGKTHRTLHHFERLNNWSEWVRYTEGVDSPERTFTISDYVLGAVEKAIQSQKRNIESSDGAGPAEHYAKFIDTIRQSTAQ